MTLDRDFQRFVEDMHRELEANAHKGEPGSWRVISPEVLWNDTMYHMAKLIYAMKHQHDAQVREFAADVANMVRMTAESYEHHRLRERKDGTP